MRQRAFNVLKTDGVLVSAVSIDPLPQRSDVRSVFFYVEVTTERLNAISQLLVAPVWLRSNSGWMTGKPEVMDMAQHA